MNVPDKWRQYSCEDYFSSSLAVHGYWSDADQLWFIKTADRVEEEKEAGFLQIARPGLDSIGFGYRKGLRGLWAYHRMELEFQYLTETALQLVDGWLSGRIKV